MSLNAYLLTFRSKWNERLLRKMGCQIGCNPHLYGRIGFDIKGKLVIGDNFFFTSGGFNNPLARNICGMFRINLGAEIKIGDNVGISSSVLWCASKITIGDDVKIGALATIIDTDAHSLDPELRRNPSTDSKNTIARPVCIGNNVLIGAQSIICKGVTIGDNSIVGIGSVVTKSIPANQIWAGNPAHFIREIQ